LRGTSPMLASTMDRYLRLRGRPRRTCCRITGSFRTVINVGNSGGLLVDEGGMVLGINTAKFSGGSAEGLGFAIAADEARKSFGTLLPTNR